MKRNHYRILRQRSFPKERMPIMKSPACASEMNRAKEICGVIDHASPEGVSLRFNRFRMQRGARGLLIYDIMSDAIFEMNDAGCEIVRLLARRCSCQQIAAHLASRYHTSLDAMLADVKEFLCILEQHGLTRIIHEASTAAADPGMAAALRSVGFLDVLSSTPAESSRRAGQSARCALQPRPSAPPRYEAS
jgi:hypothetical protein